MKGKSDHRNQFSDLSNWKEEAWKNQAFNGIRTHDLCDAGAMLYQLSYGATNVWLHSSNLSNCLNCLNWKIYCDDHSSLSSTTAVQIWVISYKLHIMSLCRWCKLGFSGRIYTVIKPLTFEIANFTKILPYLFSKLAIRTFCNSVIFYV